MTKKAAIQKNLLEELGLSGLPEEKKQDLVVSMTKVLLKRMFVETMEKLSEKDQGEYAKLIENKASAEEVENFLQGKIKDYDQMLEKISVDFKNEMAKGI
jgi:hypothetical protein